MSDGATTRLTNIGQLVAVPPGPVAGAAMSRVPVIEDAVLIIRDDRIAWFGRRADAPAGAVTREIDAGGGTVVPGLIDCHTHVVHAGAREREFVQRIEGAGYIEILEAGGGIRDSMRMLRAAAEDDLVAESLPRVRRMMAWGVTTIEAKSGYGLTPDDELKTLRAIRRVGRELSVEMIGTYLAAHTVPPEFDGRPDAYLDQMLDASLLRTIVEEGLAEFADVFCERGAFTLKQSRRFLTGCDRAGLKPKIHAEQITRTGATAMAVDLGAVSADHLEYVPDEDIRALCGSFGGLSADTTAIKQRQPHGTIPVLLPGCSFFLGSAPAPARRMIEAGLPVALATDMNPGSCPVESLPLVMSMAATILRMTPMESLVACTANAAAALGRADRIGAIAVGHQADLVVLDIPNLALWPYRVGVNPVRRILKAGRAVSLNGE